MDAHRAVATLVLGILASCAGAPSREAPAAHEEQITPAAPTGEMALPRSFAAQPSSAQTPALVKPESSEQTPESSEQKSEASDQKEASLQAAGGYGEPPTARQVVALLCEIKDSTPRPSSFMLEDRSEPEAGSWFDPHSRTWLHGWWLLVRYRTANQTGELVPATTSLLIREGAVLYHTTK